MSRRAYLTYLSVTHDLLSSDAAIGSVISASTPDVAYRRSCLFCLESSAGHELNRKLATTSWPSRSYSEVDYVYSKRGSSFDRDTIR